MNAPLPKDSTDDGIGICFKEVQLIKDPSPIFVIDDGIDMNCKDEQSLNALFEIALTDVDNEIFSILLL